MEKVKYVPTSIKVRRPTTNSARRPSGTTTSVFLFAVRPREQHAATTEMAAVDARSEKDDDGASFGAEPDMAREAEEDADEDVGEGVPELDEAPAPFVKM